MSYEHLIAGATAGLTSTFVLYPLDLLKVRFAVSDGRSKVKRHYNSIPSAVATIVKEEGYRGMYKGVTPSCLGSGASWGLYFLFYNAIKKQIFESDQSKLSLFHNMFAGACAGALTITITNPIWVVKTRLCLQYGSNNPENRRYSGTWDALKKVYRQEGVQGLYRGFVPGLLGVSHGAIQLAAYEEMKKFYIAHNNLPHDHPLGTVQYLSCALASKLLAATITYPYQVIRARLQDQHVNYDGVMDVIRKTWKYESSLGFYKGFRAYLLHVTPNVCIVFFVYENVKKFLR